MSSRERGVRQFAFTLFFSLRFRHLEGFRVLFAGPFVAAIVRFAENPYTELALASAAVSIFAIKPARVSGDTTRQASAASALIRTDTTLRGASTVGRPLVRLAASITPGSTCAAGRIVANSSRVIFGESESALPNWRAT